ncbi:MAG: spermidine synthase [Anaerolineae bacterium]
MLIYLATIFLSALLLFLVQPLSGKVILPWFGGSSAVWSTSMLFFQLLLLVGYGYSYVLVRRFPRRRQVSVHLGLLALSLLLMGVNLVFWRAPIIPGEGWAPESPAHPIQRVLLTLAVSVGLPYLVLSTTTPLVQAWFAASFPRRSPYPLYALSNLGSILALISFPFVLEPLLTVQGQASVWSVGYTAFAVVLFVVAWPISRRREHADVDEVAVPPAKRRQRLRWWQPVLWLALSTTGSILLLGTTNQITQNVTAVPLLWVGPLVVYLLTFVIAFSGEGAYSRWYLVLFFLATQLFGYVYNRANLIPVVAQLSVYGLTLFAACMVSHGEMVRWRPEPGRLTTFYLVMGGGGALGGVLVNLVAPAVFDGLWELPIALLACWIFAGISLALDRRSQIVGKEWLQILLVAVFAISTLSVLLVIWTSMRSFRQSTVVAERNFYGILRVQAVTVRTPPGDAPSEDLPPDAYRMVHGTTIHGLQFMAPELRQTPTSYFGATSGAGLAMEQVEAEAESKRVGVLGLGAGTLAAYGRSGDVMRFYEIDPEVIRYALGAGDYFSYLDDSAAEIDVIPGDARLSLERELKRGDRQDYDLLAVDVFSGDAPPVHMLTLEAFGLYLAHLDDRGLIAANISTTHVDLKPVLAGLARYLDLTGVVVEDPGGGAAHPEIFRSRWVILARDPAVLAGPRWDAYPDLATFHDPELRLWTDDYSNLVGILR